MGPRSSSTAGWLPVRIAEAEVCDDDAPLLAADEDAADEATSVGEPVSRGDSVRPKLKPRFSAAGVGGSGRRVDDEHLAEQMARLLRQVRRQRIDAVVDLFEERRDVLVVERQSAAQHDVQDHAARPDVDLGPGVQPSGDDLGRGVVGAAAARLEKVAVGHDVGEAKVADLDVEVLVEQQILGLEVAVDDLVTVAVLHGADDLLEEAPCLWLGHAAAVDNVLEEFAAGVFDDHDDVVGRGDDFVQLDDVRMAEQLEVLDLALHTSAHVEARDLAAVDDLHRHTVACERMRCELHLAEGAGAERLLDDVLADAHGLLLLGAMHRPGSRCHAARRARRRSTTGARGTATFAVLRWLPARHGARDALRYGIRTRAVRAAGVACLSMRRSSGGRLCKCCARVSGAVTIETIRARAGAGAKRRGCVGSDDGGEPNRRAAEDAHCSRAAGRGEMASVGVA
ncbi:hypothetical protein L1887_57341 [Cichorium endivia]|nr:hypothetical protein L1887_57341 [Cichorium endivia]